jgi:branched-chain amino acid aminotransferase
MKAFYNGKIVPKEDVRVHVDTVGFKYCAMVFEGIRAYWNDAERQLYAFRLPDHARRLEDSVRVMRMNTPLASPDYERAVLQALEANEIVQSAHIRQMVWVDGGGEVFGVEPVSHAVIVTPKAGWFSGSEPGIHASVSSWQRISDNTIPPRVKCAANYQNARLALLQAKLDGYDSTILLNADGKVSEEPRGCIFLVKGGRVITPQVTNDILESITRDTLIRLFQDQYTTEVVVRDVDRTELYLAQEAFVCGSGLEVTPILSIDRHRIGKGLPGEITVAIRDAYLRVARGEMEQYTGWLSPVYRSSAVEVQNS